MESWLAPLGKWRPLHGGWVVITPAQYRAIASGEARGVLASVARGALGLVAAPYGIAMRLRNLAYDRQWKRSFRAGVPVISVGNLTLGGTGKTPMVEWIARWLRARGVRAALISRGYGAAHGAQNDEALELAEKLPDVPHLQDADRVAAARRATEGLGCQAIVLDDGFQHRRLRRDLDIVLLDALDPWGGGRVFPRGLLREPLSGLRRAQLVCLSRADLIRDDERLAIRQRVHPLAPQAGWIEAAHAPLALRSTTGLETEPGMLAGRRVVAFCGIGNPAAFRRTLASLHYDVAAFREFADHHAYSPEDVVHLSAWASEHRAAALVCTQKDLVKVSGLVKTDSGLLGETPLWAVQIGLHILAGIDVLESRLNELSVSFQLVAQPSAA